MRKKILRLVELTPEVYRCIIGSCPAVYEAENGDLIVVGSSIEAGTVEALKGKVGKDESVVRISRALVEGALKEDCEQA